MKFFLSQTDDDDASREHSFLTYLVAVLGPDVHALVVVDDAHQHLVSRSGPANDGPARGSVDDQPLSRSVGQAELHDGQVANLVHHAIRAGVAEGEPAEDVVVLLVRRLPISRG